MEQLMPDQTSQSDDDTFVNPSLLCLPEHLTNLIPGLENLPKMEDKKPEPPKRRLIINQTKRRKRMASPIRIDHTIDPYDPKYHDTKMVSSSENENQEDSDQEVETIAKKTFLKDEKVYSRRVTLPSGKKSRKNSKKTGKKSGQKSGDKTQETEITDESELNPENLGFDLSSLTSLSEKFANGEILSDKEVYPKSTSKTKIRFPKTNKGNSKGPKSRSKSKDSRPETPQTDTKASSRASTSYEDAPDLPTPEDSEHFSENEFKPGRKTPEKKLTKRKRKLKNSKAQAAIESQEAKKFKPTGMASSAAYSQNSQSGPQQSYQLNFKDPPFLGGRRESFGENLIWP